MGKIIENYSPQKIEIIKRMLEKQSEKGAGMAYEIFVDNFKVVMKTTDLSEFDAYEDLMNNESKFIRINIYSSPTEAISDTKYVFEINGDKPQEGNKPLGELEVNNKIKESLSIERERWEKEQLIKELDRTKIQLQEAEEYIENITSQLEQVKLKPNHWGKLDLGMLLGSAFEGILRKNPQWVDKVPGLEGLAGVIEQENRNPNQLNHSSPDGEASFKKKENAATLTAEEQSYLSFGKHIAEHFDDEEIAVLVRIVAELGKDTAQLQTVAELLNINVSEAKKAAGQE